MALTRCSRKFFHENLYERGVFYVYRPQEIFTKINNLGVWSIPRNFCATKIWSYTVTLEKCVHVVLYRKREAVIKYCRAIKQLTKLKMSKISHSFFILLNSSYFICLPIIQILQAKVEFTDENHSHLLQRSHSNF